MINKLRTDAIAYNVNEDLEALLDLKQEIDDVLKAIRKDVYEAITHNNHMAIVALHKEETLHIALLEEVEKSVLRVGYIIN